MFIVGVLFLAVVLLLLINYIGELFSNKLDDEGGDNE